MKLKVKLAVVVLAGSFAAAAAHYIPVGPGGGRALAEPPLPTHKVPTSKDGNVVVALCDGVTTMEVKGLKPGQQMTRAQALDVSRKLMAQWQQKHPGERWQMAANDKGAQPAQATASPGKSSIAGPGTEQKFSVQQGDTYASFTERDYKLWQAQTDAFVQYGKQVFHSTKLLGGTIGISCDMCHPDGSNTHAETYPKYQVQLQRVALLRDMINWCIENPVKGATLADDDPRLRALEAYILAQRKGASLGYGKH